jgi:hypothetical protein
MVENFSSKSLNKIPANLAFQPENINYIASICLPIGGNVMSLLQIAFGIPSTKVNIFKTFDITAIVD